MRTLSYDASSPLYRLAEKRGLSKDEHDVYLEIVKKGAEGTILDRLVDKLGYQLSELKKILSNLAKKGLIKQIGDRVAFAQLESIRMNAPFKMTRKDIGDLRNEIYEIKKQLDRVGGDLEDFLLQESDLSGGDDPLSNLRAASECVNDAYLAVNADSNWIEVSEAEASVVEAASHWKALVDAVEKMPAGKLPRGAMEFLDFLSQTYNGGVVQYIDNGYGKEFNTALRYVKQLAKDMAPNPYPNKLLSDLVKLDNLIDIPNADDVEQYEAEIDAFENWLYTNSWKICSLMLDHINGANNVLAADHQSPVEWRGGGSGKCYMEGYLSSDGKTIKLGIPDEVDKNATFNFELLPAESVQYLKRHYPGVKTISNGDPAQYVQDFLDAWEKAGFKVVNTYKSRA